MKKLNNNTSKNSLSISQKKLLELINELSISFIDNNNNESFLNIFFKKLVQFTKSEIGIIEIFDSNSTPFKIIDSNFYFFSTSKSITSQEQLTTLLNDTTKTNDFNKILEKKESFILNNINIANQNNKNTSETQNLIIIPIFFGDKLLATICLVRSIEQYNKELPTFLNPLILNLSIILNTIQTNKVLQQYNEQNEFNQKINTKFLNIIDGANLGTWEWNIKTGEAIFNEKWANILGYKLEELRPINENTYFKLCHPEDRIKSTELLQMHFDGLLDYYECEIRMQHKNGDWIWVLEKGRVSSWDSLGNPIWMQGTHIDISDIKRLQVLHENEKNRLNLLINSIEGVVWELDLNNHEFTYISNKAKNIFGYELYEWTNFDFWVDKIYPEEREFVKNYCISKTNESENHTMEYRFRIKNGEYIWINDIVNVRVDSDNKPIALTGIFIDISDKKEKEKKIDELNIFLSNLINTIPGVIIKYILHSDGSDSINFMSDSSESFYKLKISEMKKNPQLLWDKVDTDYLPTIKKSLNESSKNLSDWYEIWKTISINGQSKWIEGRGVPLLLENGDVEWTILKRDITNEKEDEVTIHKLSKTLKNLVDNVPGVFFQYTTDKNITHIEHKYISDNSFEYFGLTPIEITETPELLWSSIDQETISKILHSKIEAQNNVKEWYFQWKYTNPSGVVKWFESRGRPQKINENEFEWFEFVIEISKLIENENENKYLYDFLTNIIDNIPGVVLQYNLFQDGTESIDYISPNVDTFFGVKQSDILNDCSIVWSFIDPEMIEDMLTSIKESAENLTNWLYQWKMYLPTGEIKWVEGRGIPKLLPTGTVQWVTIIIDITDLKKLDLDLIEKTKLLEHTSEIAKIGGWEYDVEKHIVEWTKVTRILHEVDDDYEINLDDAINFYHPLHKDILKNNFEKLIKDGIPYDLELLFITAKNNIIWVNAKGFPIIENQKITKVYGTFENINDRKIAQLKLEENEKRLTTLLETNSNYILLLSLSFSFTYHNNNFSNKFRFLFTETNFSDGNFRDLIYSEDQAIFDNLINESLENPYKPFNCVLRTQKILNDFIYTLWEFTTLTNENGYPSEIQCVGTDITKLKETEELLNKKNVELNAIFDSINESAIVTITNTSGKLLHINPAFEKISGYSKDELIGNNHNIVSSGFHTESFWKNFWKTIKSGQVWRDEVKNRAKDGTYYWVDTVVNPIRNENGKIVRFLSIRQDITSRKKVKDDLDQLNKELENRVIERTQELNSTMEELTLINADLSRTKIELTNSLNTKNKFFSIIGHDLKNPIAGIILSSEIIEKYIEMGNWEQVKLKTLSIKNNILTISNLLNNLLNWARSQSGLIEFNPQIEYIDGIIENVLEIFAINITNKNITLLRWFASELKAFIDKDMITTILRNLISNAIKFTPKDGKIVIKVEENDKDYIVSIADSGIGISEEDIGKLFRLDVKNSEIGNSKEKGTGLGLILCKDFVEMHNGSIWVESSLGNGSTFYFSIPKAK